MKRRYVTLGLALLVGAQAEAAHADSVPTRKAAYDYFQSTFPPAAPGVLLGEARGVDFRTRRFRLEPAPGCRRTDIQVECSFTLRLRPKKAARQRNVWPIKCHGDLWAKTRTGEIVARVGPYKCVTVQP